MPQRSHRAEVLSDAVENYVKELKRPRTTKAAVRRAERSYREAAEPYAPSPGLNALLKLEAKHKSGVEGLDIVIASIREQSASEQSWPGWNWSKSRAGRAPSLIGE